MSTWKDNEILELLVIRAEAGVNNHPGGQSRTNPTRTEPNTRDEPPTRRIESTDIHVKPHHSGKQASPTAGELTLAGSSDPALGPGLIPPVSRGHPAETEARQPPVDHTGPAGRVSLRGKAR
ncbi:unnamed protein product [Pleuronectes platessa]|uniref:Uncharacterized protein n=1 Tax=Pleuronectes platessa TaxID=8262 RepID=A0A9N7UP35_PLEPL|nr:unnamed protein product [Pleuronectes platessa]